MRIKTIAIAATLAIGTAFATSAAYATPINHLTSNEGAGYHLYEQFGIRGLNGLNTPGELDAARLSLVTGSYWTAPGIGLGIRSTQLFEWAGNANITSFGVFDRFNSATRVQLLGGSASDGDSATMSILGDGSVMLNFTTDTGIDFTTNQFGYYIQTGATTYFSDPTLNPGGSDQLAAFMGNGIDTLTSWNYAPDLFNTTDYILAWEDILTPTGDDDFNDKVMIQEIVAVPEPGTLAVLGMGLLGLGYMRRRQTAKA